MSVTVCPLTLGHTNDCDGPAEAVEERTADEVDVDRVLILENAELVLSPPAITVVELEARLVEATDAELARLVVVVRTELETEALDDLALVEAGALISWPAILRSEFPGSRVDPVRLSRHEPPPLLLGTHVHAPQPVVVSHAAKH